MPAIFPEKSHFVAKKQAVRIIKQHFKHSDETPHFPEDVCEDSNIAWIDIEKRLSPKMLVEGRNDFYRQLRTIQESHPDLSSLLVELESSASAWATGNSDLGWLLGQALGRHEQRKQDR